MNRSDVDAVTALCDRNPDVLVGLPETSRMFAADLEGPTDGTPVLLVHGTPDSRLARHPDTTILDDLDARLIAVDRPGFGHSSIDETATPQSFGGDVCVLLDHLGLHDVHLVAWSAGAIWALGVADAAPQTVRSVTIVGGLVPVEAFADSAVRAAAGEARLGMVDTARELGAEPAAEMIAPLLVPDPMNAQAALEHRVEAGSADLDTVPGATIRMAAACCDAVRSGHGGLVRDMTIQLGDHGLDLTRIETPIRLLTGEHDTTCPPAFARWYGNHLPHAEVAIVPDAGHGLLLTHWRAILDGIVRRRS